MTRISEKEIKEDLNNLINALYALSPTRSYLLQFLELLPKDYPTLVDVYPELFKDKETRERVKNILGLTITERVDAPGTSLAGALKYISSTIRSDFFGRSYSNWRERQKKLTEYLGRELPNVVDELWVHKIQMALSEPTYGDIHKKIFSVMTEKGEGRKLEVDLAKMVEESCIEEPKLLRAKNFLVNTLGILSSTEGPFALSYELSERNELLKKCIR